MAQAESDDLSQLMPNLQLARLATSPGNTMALREYIKVLGEKPANVPAASAAQPLPKARTDGLAPRTGTGRRPQRRFFTIKWRTEEVNVEQQAAAVEADAEAALDPEALKDALVEQAQAQRRALVQASQRAGTGRVPRRREFAITLPPLQLEPEEEEELDADAAAAEAAAHEVTALAAEEAAAVAEEEAAAAAEQLQQAELEAAALQQEEAENEIDAAAAAPYWEGLAAEEGVVAEKAAVLAPQPVDAATPGAPLQPLEQQQHLDGLEQGGSSDAEAAGAAGTVEQQQQQEPGTSQQAQAQARTPGTSLFGGYTPMEGVPERLALLATRGKGVAVGAAGLAAATVTRSARPAGTPAGFTPLEGIPERLMAFQAMPGATRVCSNAGGRPSVDSPVEGLVLQGAACRRASAGGVAARPAAAAAPAVAAFGGFVQPAAPSPGALPAPAALLERGPAGGWAVAPADADAHDFGDNAGMDGIDAEGPWPAGGCAVAGLPHMADAAVQTGTSLAAGEATAAAAGGSPDANAAAHERQEEPPPVEDNGYDEGYDAGGDMDDLGGFEEEEEEEEDADPPESSAVAERRAQRQSKNPGVRLRNEHKRKSLVADPGIGRHEVLPGVRRSSRQRQEPLKWWLNEKLEFGRSHKTMPTVNNVVHKVPNTPWQTVTDIKRRPAKKQRAPTPADLEGALAGAREGDGEEEAEVQRGQAAAAAAEQEEPEQRRQQQQQRSGSGSGSGGRQAASQQRATARGRQPRGAAGKQPPAARGVATKKKGAAAGGNKKRKAQR